METVKTFDDLLQSMIIKDGDLDGMTQLFNKVAFGRNLDNLIASNRNNNLTQASRRKSDSDNGKSQRKAAILMLDLDGFKRINDEISHAAGDTVLMKVAEILKSELRRDQKTIIGRLGGDEFGIAIEVEDDEEAQEIQKRLDHIFNTMKPLSPEQATQTIVFGEKSQDEAIAEFVQDNYEYEHILYPVSEGQSPDDLLENSWKLRDNKIIIPIRGSVGMVIADLDQNAAHALDQADQAMYEVKKKHHRDDSS